MGRELGLPQEDVGLESRGGLDGKRPCAFVSGSDIEKRKKLIIRESKSGSQLRAQQKAWLRFGQGCSRN